MHLDATLPVIVAIVIAIDDYGNNYGNNLNIHKRHILCCCYHDSAVLTSTSVLAGLALWSLVTSAGE